MKQIRLQLTEVQINETESALFDGVSNPDVDVKWGAAGAELMPPTPEQTEHE